MIFERYLTNKSVYKDVEESMDTSETNEDAKVKVKTADDVSAKKANSEEASTSPTVNGDVTEEAKESVGAASIQVKVL